MKERPILFSAPMVLALLDGRKTQTRRVLSVQPISSQLWGQGVPNSLPSHFCVHARWAQPYPRQLKDLAGNGADPWLPCPYGKVGDKLWVKEAAWICSESQIADYVATMDPDAVRCAKDYNATKRSARYMPRWASRLTLTITDIRCEQVQDISDADALAEGVRPGSVKRGDMVSPVWFGVPECGDSSPRGAFISLWESINNPRGGNCPEDAPKGWEANPYCWAVTFTVDEQEARA